MYIPPFVCGIAATILAELAAAIIYSAYTDWKINKSGRR